MSAVMEEETYTPEECAKAYVLGVTEALARVAAMSAQIGGCDSFSLPVRAAFLAFGTEMVSLLRQFKADAAEVLNP